MEGAYMDPDFGSHRDFRSPSVSKQRRRKDRVKYYSYRAVHPSLIGREYYALHLVSSTIHTVQVKPGTLRYQTPTYHVTHVMEKDEPALFATLKTAGTRWDFLCPYWLTMLSSEIHIAVAQAKATEFNSFPIVVPNPDPSSSATSSGRDTVHDIDDPNDPRGVERVYIDPPLPFPDHMPNNLHLKLQVKTWTKQDNFNTKAFFTGGPDVRHHRGKRRYRERHLQKEGEKERGRGPKQRKWALHNEIVGYSSSWSNDLCLCFDFPEYHPTKTPGNPWCDIVIDNVTTYQDMNGDFLGTDYRRAEEVAWPKDEGCAGHRSQGVDEVELLHRVLDWRQSAGDLAVVSGYDVVDTFSIGSDFILLEQNSHFDADVDAVSDLTGLIMQQEWDMLSESSSSDSQGFVTIN